MSLASLDPSAKEAYGYVSGRVDMLLEEHGRLPLDAGMHTTVGRAAVCGFGFEVLAGGPLREAGTTMYLESTVKYQEDAPTDNKFATIPGIYIGEPDEWGIFIAQSALYLKADGVSTASEGALELRPGEALGLVQQELLFNDCRPTMDVALAIVRPQ